MIFPSRLLADHPGHLANYLFTRRFLALRVKLFVVMLALIGVGRAAAADCPKAVDWARAFYTDHYLFYAEAPDPILKFTTPEFGAVLKKEWAYANGEVGHLDYDPWLGAQDGDIGKPVRFSVESESPEVVIVAVSYPYVLEKHQPKQHTAHLVLHKGEHDCWLLNDFITPVGDSLSHVYSAPEP